MRSLIGAAFVAGALVVAGAGCDQSGRRSVAGEGAKCRHIRRHRFQRAPLCQALLSSLRLFSPVLPSHLLRSARLLSAISLSFTGAVHLRHRVWSGLVVSVASGRLAERNPQQSHLRWVTASPNTRHLHPRVHLCGRRIHGAFTCLSLTSRWERPQRNATGTSRRAAEGAPSPVREVHPWRYPIPDAALSAVWA